MASDIHDLTTSFAADPDVISARCDGRGWVTVITRRGISPDGVRCPACLAHAIDADIATMTPARFAQPVPLQADVRDAIRRWIMTSVSARSLYLSGHVGTGKTHAAWMAVGAWCRATSTRPCNDRVIFTRMVDLLDSLRPGAEPCDRMRACQKASLLVIDDLGAERPSDWTRERLYSIVDHRYAHCLPLLITGNLPPKVLADQASDRVASRLAEMCTVVPMTGPDRRRPDPGAGTPGPDVSA